MGAHLCTSTGVEEGQFNQGVEELGSKNIRLSEAAKQILGDEVMQQPPTPSQEVLDSFQPIYFDNGGVYQGEWRDNMLRHGYGVQTTQDGAKHEGFWKDDKADGWGRKTFPEGDIYEGMWKAG